jgi:hypothetical protein
MCVPFFNLVDGLGVGNEIKTIVTICNRIDGEYTGIIEHLEVGVTNASMERFNADVARVIARGHGYKDQQYLFLKLRQLAKK